MFIFTALSNGVHFFIKIHLHYFAEAPSDVIKVYRADQSFRFIYVNKDTTAGDAVKKACKEFGISDNVSENALRTQFPVSVEQSCHF